MEERVLVELPDGLKRFWRDFKKKHRGRVFFTSRGVYGACDIGYTEAKELGARIIHVGHHRYADLKAEFVPWNRPVDLSFVRLDDIPDEFYLATISPYYHAFDKMKTLFKDRRVHIKNGRLTGLPLILGCDTSAIGEDLPGVVIATGRFYKRAFRNPRQRVLFLDPVSRTQEWIDTERIYRWRAAKYLALREKKSIAVLISLKPGQKRLRAAERLADELEEAGKETLLIVGNEISEATLINYGVEAAITTACPRFGEDMDIPIIALDEFYAFKQKYGF